MSNEHRKNSGREAKRKGHEFEREVADYLSNKMNKPFIIEGANNTKVDIRSSDNCLRYSVKKTPTNLQVGLITQQNFINALNITDPQIKQFISEFFGGDSYSAFPRHRKKISEINTELSNIFLDFLHSRIEDILKIAITHGSLSAKDNINYILFPSIKHDVTTLQIVDISSFISEAIEIGKWRFNPTTIDLCINDIKVINIQMFGSGTRYSNSFHSLQFRISCGKINEKHITSINT
jgi:hypothetical protein